MILRWQWDSLGLLRPAIYKQDKASQYGIQNLSSKTFLALRIKKLKNGRFLPHPLKQSSKRNNLLLSQFDEQLDRIRSSESTCSTSFTITSKLTHLSGLYECIDELLQLHSSQKAVSRQGKWADDALEGSVKFLDVCSTITDVMVQMKERAQQLQSILRRRCSKDEIASEVAQYLRTKKKVIKVVSKTLKDLKKSEINYNENTDVINRLRECQMMTLDVLESVLVSIVGAKARSNWESIVSKVLKSKSHQETQVFLVGFEASDATLHPELVMSGLENMETSLKDVEQGVEILFRHLIKTRTTILNILNIE